MKCYVNCYREKTYGYYYATAEEARESAQPSAYAVAVEIELPDPPHQWKIGDWGQHIITRNAVRLVDRVGSAFAMHGRLSSGDCFGETIELHWLQEHYIPCDPPAWWSEDGATPQRGRTAGAS